MATKSEKDKAWQDQLHEFEKQLCSIKGCDELAKGHLVSMTYTRTPFCPDHFYELAGASPLSFEDYWSWVAITKKWDDETKEEKRLARNEKAREKRKAVK